MKANIAGSQGASTVEEAVTAYYDNPNRYSGSAMSGDNKTSKKAPLAAFSNGKDVLPTYETAERSTIHSHTNAVIQAAQVRAQDEVGEESLKAKTTN